MVNSRFERRLLEKRAFQNIFPHYIFAGTCFRSSSKHFLTVFCLFSTWASRLALKSFALGSVLASKKSIKQDCAYLGFNFFITSQWLLDSNRWLLDSKVPWQSPCPILFFVVYFKYLYCLIVGQINYVNLNLIPSSSCSHFRVTAHLKNATLIRKLLPCTAGFLFNVI